MGIFDRLFRQKTKTNTIIDTIFKAVEQEQFEKVQELLRRDQSIANSCSTYSITTGLDVYVIGKWTLLFFSLIINSNNKDILKLLLENGANVNECVDFKHYFGTSSINCKQTALHWATNKNDIDTVEFLLANGADINAKAENGDTPLHFAEINGHKDIVDLLLQKGADVNIMNKSGRTPAQEREYYEKNVKPVKKLLNKLGGENM